MIEYFSNRYIFVIVDLVVFKGGCLKVSVGRIILIGVYGSRNLNTNGYTQ